MKSYLFIFLQLLSLTLFAQQRDTTFLVREVADKPEAYYHAVFIDSSANIKNKLTSFSFNHYDSITYFDQLKTLGPLAGNKTPIHTFPKRWVALYKWQGNYYLYRPSDLGNHFRFEITDSTTIDFNMEGPEPSRLNTISFPTSTHAVIDRTNYWEGKQVQIQLVDTARGIAVFTFSPTRFWEKSYQCLMLDASKANLFPVVVNYCLTNKEPEFDFDKVDFKLLLR